MARAKEAIENQYAPLSKFAQSASQLAYSQLMAPQFMAKLMGNDALRANLTEDQKTLDYKIYIKLVLAKAQAMQCLLDS